MDTVSPCNTKTKQTKAKAHKSCQHLRQHQHINVTRYKCSFKHGNIDKPLSQHTCKTNYTDICFAGFIDIQTQENMFLEERRR